MNSGRNLLDLSISCHGSIICCLRSTRSAFVFAARRARISSDLFVLASSQPPRGRH
jgi:hypothetical protein